MAMGHVRTDNFNTAFFKYNFCYIRIFTTILNYKITVFMLV